jgi:hypothetical protein
VSLLALLLLTAALPARSEILAMMNYESKSPDSLKSLKLGSPPERREGIAVIDIDPESPNFGTTLVDLPLPPDLVAHHIFYDRTMTKAYVTALGKGELRVIDMTRNPYRVKLIPIPGCKLGEDVVFDETNTTWYLTCMASANVIVGDVASDSVRREIAIPDTFPHGIAVHSGIDRILVTSTVSADLKDARETITVLQASSGKILGSHKLSHKPSPSGTATRRSPTSPTCSAPRCGAPRGTRARGISTSPRCSISIPSVPVCRWRCTSTSAARPST